MTKAYHKMMNRDKKNNDEDFFETPKIATLELLKRERFDGGILEPACGKGAISEVIVKQLSNPLWSSDLYDRGYGETGVDFFDIGLTVANNIITNPPYKVAEKFIQKSLALVNGKVVMLLRLMFLESQRRYELFTTTPLKTVYVFSYRLAFKPPEGVEWNQKGGGMVPYAWFVWDKTYEGKPMLEWINKDAR